ncbi:DUF4097 family beta strand repeat-containing protein [Nocardioides albus]|uniref:DUF4097 and DUF4098 domain-containing protein YvlB n=1 Tax=Nocardioides albus TaxID=1841 RepID=A0A7W5FA10_9ACTN|nr:DUF4097 family beta strand repeat-containing protein [Nocardioides albus]MBB3090641.1 DUF4097 and DUF4098 domain-containing protein YvlB [Nocardioides albus]GGU25389.1 hypothetical protein GCM10007979_25250 [Nocardioides albus]
MSTYTFMSTAPAKLFVEFDKGNLEVQTTDTDETIVEIDGDDAESLVVEQSGDTINVIDPRRGPFNRSRHYDITITAPSHSQLRARTGTADIATQGVVRAAWIQTGSGDVRIDRVLEELQVETGSGDVEADALHGRASIKSGSGDIRIGTAHDLHTKTGSGTVEIDEVEGDVSHSTGAGDFAIHSVSAGRISVKGASSDVRIGIPNGTPVWTDINTVTGRCSSTVQSAGAPAAGEPYVELRTTTVSGDVTLVGL